MARRLLYLNGIAALLLPFHHATAYGLSAIVSWGNEQVTIEQLSNWTFVLSMLIRQLDAFAIPAFLFVSGYFVAFTTRGKVRWEAVLQRIKWLLAPLIIWTFLVWVLLQRIPQSVDDVLMTYYYIPLIIQMQLLSPFLSKLAQKRWKLLLVVAGLLQFSVMGLRYVQALGLSFPGMPILLDLTPLWFFPSRIFYFSMGVVIGIHLTEAKSWLQRHRFLFLGVVILSAALSFGEYVLVSRISRLDWIGPNFGGIMRTTYAVTFILAFIAFDKTKLPGKKQVEEVGGRSLGVYLMNTPVIYIFSSLMFHFTPGLYDSTVLYQIVLVITGLSIPLLGMYFVLKSPLRPTYRYLFG